jgi:glycosyltransferase involved in cell wall biosynthesis
MTRVRVVMATYNGERFLREQMDSVLDQTHASLEILVRDDGSSDTTLEILAGYTASHPNIRVIAGKNVGAAANFFCMLREPIGDVELTAFCGHDDVWRRDKIERAVDWLATIDGSRPAAYCGRQRYIDAHGTLLGHSTIPTRGLRFENALVENVVSGGTLVINRALRDLVLETTDPSRALWEDWWIYLVASAFGTILYDPVPTLDYRKHATNAVATTSGRSRWHQVQRLLATSHTQSAVSRQAEAFRDVYGARLDPARRRVLDDFLESPHTAAARVRRAATCRTYRQVALEGLMVRGLMAMGRL